MLVSKWINDNLDYDNDFEPEEKWANMEVVETFKMGTKGFPKLLSSYRGFCDVVAVITDGKRYYQAALFYNYKNYYNYTNFKLTCNWLKNYTPENKDQTVPSRAPNTRKPIDLSYRRTDEWALYEQAKTDSDKHNETNDCVVIAVSLATGVEYSRVHSLMKKYGRQDRSGTYQGPRDKTLKNLGFKLEVVPEFERVRSYAGNRSKSKGFSVMGLRDKLENANYLISISGHLLAAVNGQVLDWSRNRKSFVESVYRVVKL